MNSSDLTPDSDIAPPELTLWLKVPMVTYLLIIHFFGVTSNIIAAIIYGRTSPKSACDWLILTMSITDAFVCFCSPALYVRSYLRIPLPWKTSILCTLEYWLQLTAMTASCMLLAIIALDRYVKICRPRLPSLTPTMARNVCIFTVLISAVVCLMPFFRRMVDSHCYISEIRKTGVTKVFFTSMFCCFVVSFCIVTFAYASICKQISQKIKLKQRLMENNGLNLPIEQDNKQEAKKHVPCCPNLWPQIFSPWPNKWKIRIRAPGNNNEIQSKSSNDSSYSNGNIIRKRESISIHNQANDVADNEKAVFLNTDFKINISTSEIMPRKQTDNLSENNVSHLPNNETDTDLAVNTSNQHFTAANGYTTREGLDTYTDTTPSRTDQLVSETLQERVPEKQDGLNGAIFLQQDDGDDTLCVETVQDNDAISSTCLKMGNYAKDNIDSSSQFTAAGLHYHGGNPVVPPYSREPVMSNCASSSRESVNLEWARMSRVSVSDSNLLHTKRNLRQEIVRNYADDLKLKQKYLIRYSNNKNTGNNCDLKSNKGNKSMSKKYCTFFCLLPKNSHFSAKSFTIKSTHSYPNVCLTKCGERDSRLRFLRSHSSHQGHLSRNNMVENDGINVGLAQSYSLSGACQPHDKKTTAEPRLSSSCTSYCTRCFQQSRDFHVNDNMCSFYRLAANDHRQRLVTSDPYLSLHAKDGSLFTANSYDRAVLTDIEILVPPTAFWTKSSTNEGIFTSYALPGQRPSSKLASSYDLKDDPTDILHKGNSVSVSGNQADSQQFYLSSSFVPRKDTSTPADEIQQELNYPETADTASFLLPRPPPQTALKPSGSTSSRRSNKSSSFADPLKTTLTVDNNNYADDNSEVFSEVSASPSMSAFKRSRLKGGCRISRRSRSSVRSTTSSKLRFARERQMTFMLLSVTAAFLLSWMPPWVMYMTSLYGPVEYSKSAIIQYLGTIHLLNYVASPVIYFTFNPTFRSKVSQLLTPSRKLHCCSGKETCQLESPDINSSRI